MRGAGVLGGLAIIAGSAAGAIHPLAAVGVLLGVCAIVWVLSSPFNATLAFLIVLIARPADLMPGLEVLKPAKVLAISALGLWLLGKLLREDLTISRAPHGKWMVALGVAVLLSTLTSSHPAASMALFTDSFVKILIMYALIVHLVDDKERAVKLHVTLSLCTTGLALYALHAKISGVATVEADTSTVGTLPTGMGTTRRPILESLPSRRFRLRRTKTDRPRGRFLLTRNFITVYPKIPILILCCQF